MKKRRIIRNLLPRPAFNRQKEQIGGQREGGGALEENFSAVCQVYYDRLYRFLLALSGDPHQAEDLTQEVFYRALLHIDRYREQGQMFTWLCAIGKNLWLSQCRRKRAAPEPLHDTPQPGPEETLSDREVQQALRMAVAALPEDYRDVVILYVYGDIPLKEISAMKGKSESWAKVTYYRAKQMLRQELEGLG